MLYHCSFLELFLYFCQIWQQFMAELCIKAVYVTCHFSVMFFPGGIRHMSHCMGLKAVNMCLCITDGKLTVMCWHYFITVTTMKTNSWTQGRKEFGTIFSDEGALYEFLCFCSQRALSVVWLLGVIIKQPTPILIGSCTQCGIKKSLIHLPRTPLPGTIKGLKLKQAMTQISWGTLL